MNCGPNILHVKVADDAFSNKKLVELVMPADCVTLKKVGPYGGWSDHTHVLVDIGAGPLLEFDMSELHVEFEVDKIDVPPLGGVAVGHVSGEEKAVLSGVAAEAVLWAAEQAFGVPGFLPSEGWAKVKFKFPEPWGNTLKQPPSVAPKVAVPSHELMPWQVTLDAAGVTIELHAHYDKAADSVHLMAKGVYGPAYPAYAAGQEVKREVEVSQPGTIDGVANGLVAKAVEGAMASAAKQMTEKFFGKKPGVSVVMGGFAPQAPADGKALADVKAALDGVGKVFAGAAKQVAKAGAAFGHKPFGCAAPYVSPWGGTAADFKQVAAEHGLAARVAPAYPQPGCVLVALYKFDGRPAEFEECAAVAKTLEALTPVGTLVECAPLTPGLAAKLPEDAASFGVWEGTTNLVANDGFEKSDPSSGKLWDPEEAMKVAFLAPAPGPLTDADATKIHAAAPAPYVKTPHSKGAAVDVAKPGDLLKWLVKDDVAHVSFPGPVGGAIPVAACGEVIALDNAVALEVAKGGIGKLMLGPTAFVKIVNLGVGGKPGK